MSARDPLTTSPAHRSWISVLSEPTNLLAALKWGAIVGVAYYVVNLLMLTVLNAILRVNDNVGSNPLIALPLCIGIFALAFGLYTAGYQAGIARMHVAPGVLSALIMLGLSNLLSRLYSPTTQQIVTKTSSSSSAVGVVGVVSLLFAVGIAAGLGYAGAFYGIKGKLKAQAQKTA
jgi:hypothetical protein